MSNIDRIAIVGAGVAGMALAILAAKQGYQVSLYERGSQVSSMGAGVTLWPNAVYIMQQMGLEKELMHLGGTPRLMRQFNQQGVLLGELDIETMNSLSGFTSVTILRRDLMKLLDSALDGLGVERQFNCTITPEAITGLKQDFDLVVGADGRMHSVVRQVLYQGQITPRYQGFINIIGISQMDGALDNAIHDYRGRGERFGIVPVAADVCYWAAAWSTSMDKERPLSGWYEEMHRRFLGWPDPLQCVLSSYDKASLRAIFVHDLDPLPYWHEDNLLMIGDAAHAPLPTSGQGACQALEDAWHLVRILAEEDELDSALPTFYQRRIDKASAAQAAGRQLAQGIFAAHSEPPASVSDISLEQLTQFWMQGLAVE
ncbi:2-polyprenyl-6-methoxyphenol hydroxylase [Amphritea atlantica]|uniref:2-polyprenyl-6-methoxyphenol hydroxylase n=1 Tax=Amphritea atlantica TaxID=355243 RepID=A0A1H9I4K8_9GAMM|nr:FAD-dependent monooxygenase [Amphritea atlantica]SEQ69519.1 2-polyprenyl-6-methoxyphenol hydroxylase [Amphritea atlantica]